MRSPTALLKLVLITADIDAEEKRDAAIIDFSGSFLHAENGNNDAAIIQKCLIELVIVMASLMLRTFILTKKGNPILYVKHQKA